MQSKHGVVGSEASSVRTRAFADIWVSSRNIGKVRDWIDLVFVKKRFYSSEAVFAAPPPPVSRTQVRRSAHKVAT